MKERTDIRKLYHEFDKVCIRNEYVFQEKKKLWNERGREPRFSLLPEN